MVKIINKLFLFPLIIFFGGCTFGNLTGVTTNTSKDNFVHEKKNWTYMIYMAADNNLEPAAVEDFNEIEASDFNSDDVNIIVLFDRNEIKDSSDSDEWVGTRMYEMCKDPNGMNHSICSKRIGCSEIGLSSKREKLLDMGSPEVMTGFIENVKKYYPANHFGFFVWGHGTGYRNAPLTKNLRAVALDDSGDSFMENKSVATSIKLGMKETKLDFLLYDTCFAAELEVVYEFPDAVEYFMGSQGIQVVSGLDYKKVFSTEIGKKENGLDALLSIEEILSDEMKKDFSIINLSEVKNVFSIFDGFASSAATFVSTQKDGEELRELILKDGECHKSFEALSNPVYVNILSLVKIVSEKYESLTSYLENLKNALGKAVCCKNKTDEKFPLGIYFCSVDSSNVLIEDSNPYYFHGSESNKCSFVNDSTGYVLTQLKTGSLMDKLFNNFNF